MKKSLPAILLLAMALPAIAQTAASPVTIAIFPFKNLSGEVIYNDLSWAYTDSLYHYLMTREGVGTTFNLVPTGDVRDQMLAMNIDITSPAYETQVWEVAKQLGATKIIWGTYFVKYKKANIEAKVIDTKTLLADPTHFAEKVRLLYDEALQSVATVGERILPAMK
jgi:hypothetical protein